MRPRVTTQTRKPRHSRPPGSPTAGHFGYSKTLELLRRSYVWPNVRTDRKKFFSQCFLCARNKPGLVCWPAPPTCMHLPLGCYPRAKVYFNTIKACSCPGKHSQHLRKLPLQYDSATSKAFLIPHYSPGSPFAFESLRSFSTASNMNAPPVSSSDEQGRTQVLAFGGTSNQFDDTVSRISPTPMLP